MFGMLCYAGKRKFILMKVVIPVSGNVLMFMCSSITVVKMWKGVEIRENISFDVIPETDA